MRPILITCLTVLVLSHPSVVRAQGGADLRKAADASVDRNFFTPTAETVSAGDVTFNSYELFLAGLTVGITDRVQVSATTLLPVVADIPLVLLASLKWQVITWDRLRLAIQPDAWLVSSDGEYGGALGAQVLLDVILDDGGKYVLSFAEANKVPFGNFSGEAQTYDMVIVGLSAAASAQLGSHLKLIVEFTMPGGFHDGTSELVEQALLVTYGLRFFGSGIAADLAFARPLHPDVAGDFTDVLPMGVPLVTFSGRF